MEVREGINAQIGAKKRPVYLYCLLISAVLLLVATKSSPLYPLNDWVDVNIYFTIGKGLFRGYVPYLDLYDQKGPTVYLLYGLASLLSGKSFFGVYLLETLSFSLFLYISYRIITLFAPARGALLALPVLGAAILPSMAFSHGGSLEEFCLPVFAFGLYASVRYYKSEYPAPPRLSMAAVNGLLAGLLFTAKFTLTAFYVGWLAVLFFSQCRQRRVGTGLLCCAAFLAGMALPLVAWVVYFASQGALPAFWRYYFATNVAGYSALESPTLVTALFAIGRSTLVAFVRNWQYALLAVLGLFAITFARRNRTRPVERVNVWALIVPLACGMYMGGQSFRYYALVFAAFAPLGLAAMLGWLSIAEPDELGFRVSAARHNRVGGARITALGSPSRRRLVLPHSGRVKTRRPQEPQFSWMSAPAARRHSETLFQEPQEGSGAKLRFLERVRLTLLCLSGALPARMRSAGRTRLLLPALSLAAAGVCLLASPNTYLLGTPKADTPQYRFAAEMEEKRTEGSVTLLCRAFPDSGFYFAADVIPDCRFFTSNNVMLPEVAEEQWRRVEAGVPEFVVMRDREDAPGARYTRIDSASLPYEQYVCTYYLYQRIPIKE